jgi:glycosyltransferase involved in cell wall biosynthesis
VRVALLSYDFGEYCVRLANGLARHAEVLLLLSHDEAAGVADLVDDAVCFRPFEKPRLRQPLRQLRSLARLSRELRAFRPDVVHLQQGHLWGNLLLPTLRAPLVVTVHDVEHHPGDRASSRTPQRVLHAGFRRGQRLLVHAERLRGALCERLAIPAERVDVVPHIAIGRERGDDAPPEEPTTVLFFGRLWPYKGLDVLIRAEPLLSAAIPDVRIVVAGAGEPFERYAAMMVHPERFEVHHRYLSDEERDRFFERAAVVVLPYLEASQSGVVPVAFRAGRPVVATTVGGLPEVVDHGETGLLVPPGDERALAEAILTLLRDAPLRRRLGGEGRRRLEARAGSDAVARLTLASYRRALDGAQPAARRS